MTFGGRGKRTRTKLTCINRRNLTAIVTKQTGLEEDYQFPEGIRLRHMKRTLYSGENLQLKDAKITKTA